MTRRMSLFLVIVTLMSLGLSACAPAAKATTKVVCPLNIKALQPGENKDCVVWDGIELTTDKASRYVVDDGLELGPNQAGIYRPSNDDRPVQIFEGIGFHSAPKKYSMMVEVGQRDIFTSENCPANQVYNECVGPLDQLQLAGGITAVGNISVGIQPILNKDNASQWLEIGGYAGFMGQLWKEIRGYRNKTSNIEPNFVDQNQTVTAFEKFYTDSLSKWRYADLFTLTDFSFRGFVIGDQALRDAMASTRAEQAKAKAQADLYDQLMANEQKRQQLELLRQNFQATLDANRAHSFRAQVDEICKGMEDKQECVQLVYIYVSGGQGLALDSNGNLTGQGTVPATPTP